MGFEPRLVMVNLMRGGEAMATGICLWEDEFNWLGDSTTNWEGASAAAAIGGI